MSSSDIDVLLDKAMEDLESNYFLDRKPDEFRRDPVFLYERLETACYRYLDFWKANNQQLPHLELEGFTRELFKRSKIFNGCKSN